MGLGGWPENFGLDLDEGDLPEAPVPLAPHTRFGDIDVTPAAVHCTENNFPIDRLEVRGVAVVDLEAPAQASIVVRGDGADHRVDGHFRTCVPLRGEAPPIGTGYCRSVGAEIRVVRLGP